MKIIILLIGLFTISLKAQTPGTITVTSVTTIAATSGGATGVSCTFDNSVSGFVKTTCTSNGVQMMTQTAAPQVGVSNGVAGSFVVGSNSVGWILTQPTTGVFGYSITANGTSRNGSF